MEFDSNSSSDFFQDKYGMKQWERRHAKTTEILDTFGVKKILDLGCSDGRLIRRLTRDDNIQLIIGVDICEEALAKAKENSEPELFHMLQPKEKDSSLSIFLFQANILKDLKFLLDYDIEAITSIEVVEHLKREDIDTFALNIFGILSPKYVILTTPNYNFNYWFDPTQRVYPFRHWDHKFEMTQSEFEEWCQQIAQKYNYFVEFDGVGLPKNGDLTYGYCSQFAIFQKNDELNINFLYEELSPQEIKLISDIKYPYKEKKDEKEIFINEIIYHFHDYQAKRFSEEIDFDQDYRYKNYVPVEYFLTKKEISNFIHTQDDFFKFLSSCDFKDYTIEISKTKKEIQLLNKNQDEEISF